MKSFVGRAIIEKERRNLDERPHLELALLLSIHKALGEKVSLEDCVRQLREAFNTFDFKVKTLRMDWARKLALEDAPIHTKIEKILQEYPGEGGEKL